MCVQVQQTGVLGAGASEERGETARMVRDDSGTALMPSAKLNMLLCMYQLHTAQPCTTAWEACQSIQQGETRSIRRTQV